MDRELSRIYRRKRNLDGSNSYRPDKNFLDGSRICREVIKTKSRKLRWIENVIRSVEKSSPKVSIDSYLSRVVEMGENSFLKKRKTQI